MGPGCRGSGSGLGVSAGEMESPSTAGLHDRDVPPCRAMALRERGETARRVFGHLGRGADGQTDSHLASPLEARGIAQRGCTQAAAAAAPLGVVTLDRHSGSQIDPSKAGMYRHLTETRSAWTSC